MLQRHSWSVVTSLMGRGLWTFSQEPFGNHAVVADFSLPFIGQSIHRTQVPIQAGQGQIIFAYGMNLKQWQSDSIYKKQYSCTARSYAPSVLRIAYH